MTIFAGLAYLGAAAGVRWFYVQHQGISEVGYLDVVLWRRAEVRQNQGAADISRGIEALKAGRLREASNYLRTGVARAPEHLEGRLLLIRMYARSHPQLAADLFAQGQAFHGRNGDYLRAYAHFLSQRRDDEQLLRLVREALADEALTDSGLAQSMALFGMQAALRSGQFEIATDFYHDHALGATVGGLLEASRALTRLGRREEAIELLRSALATPLHGPVLPLHAQLINLYLDGGNTAAATEAALELSLQAPLDWQPRLLLLTAYERGGHERDLRRESSALLRQFRQEPSVGLGVARLAQRTGRVNLAREAYDAALENGFELAPFVLLFFETHLVAEDFAGTLALCDELDRESPPWLDRNRATFNRIRSTAAYASGQLQIARIYQRELLQSAGHRADILHAAARDYLDAGVVAPARELLEAAHSADPADENILAELVELQVESDDRDKLSARINTLLTLRRPDHALLAKIHRKLAGERFAAWEERETLVSALRVVLTEVERAAERLAFTPARISSVGT